MTGAAAPSRSKSWRWGVCLLLLLATTINYMDRMTLANTALRVKAEFTLNNQQYGNIEKGFSWAFAAGSLAFGILADRVNIRFLYPVVLLLWSLMGVASGVVRNYEGLLICRTLLGLFEAGHWPCALKTVQRILEPRDRAMGNGLLQSGASIGAVITPWIVQAFLDRGLGWRMPFQVVGAVGSAWAVFWFLTIRSDDLAAAPEKREEAGLLELVLSRRFLALVIMIALINTTWQVLRAWLVLFLHEGRGYEERFANRFTSAYYIATDLGVLTSGFIALRLARRGWTVHLSRVAVFVGMSMLAMSTIAASVLPAGWPLLGSLLIAGFGILGVFPCYYSFAQEVPERHVGKVNGLLGVCGWIVTGQIQELFGKTVDRLHSYDLGVALAGCAPLLAIIIFVLLWNRDPVERRPHDLPS
ncbi:MAG: MFS transporter [Planctomycetes bacterium]|nr:MFS transporter [Planctomycetota bacterium]